MRKKFNPRLHQIEISPIVSISEKAKVLAPLYQEKTGRPFLFFQRGDIDLPVFEEIKRETIQALEAGQTKYPLSGGSADVRQAILEKLERYNKIEGLSPDSIVLTYGGQEALQISFELFRKGRGAGFSPIWSVILESFVPYSDVRFTEIPLAEDFSVDFKVFEKVISKGIDFLYLNNPQNPTGKIFSAEELEKIAVLCRKKKIFIISDEAYEYIVYDSERHTSIASLPVLKDYPDIITVPTFSKTFSMTGFRSGYAVTKNKSAAELIKRAQYTHTAGVVSFIQPALKRALTLGERIVERLAEFQKRRDVLYQGLAQIPNLETTRPQGALYMFPNFAKFIPKNKRGDGNYIFNRLLENGICVVPGAGFTKTKKYDSYVRLAFSALPVEKLQEGVKRFKEVLLD